MNDADKQEALEIIEDLLRWSGHHKAPDCGLRHSRDDRRCDSGSAYRRPRCQRESAENFFDEKAAEPLTSLPWELTRLPNARSVPVFRHATLECP